MVSVFEGSEMTLSVWSWDVQSVGQDPKGRGSQVQMKGGTWFAVDVTPAEYMTAVAGAFALYVKEERNLRVVRAA